MFPLNGFCFTKVSTLEGFFAIGRRPCWRGLQSLEMVLTTMSLPMTVLVHLLINLCCSLPSFPEQPSATIYPTTKTFQAGNNLLIKCQVNGFPAPSVMWYKDGFQLELSRRITAKEDGVLFISNAQLSDAGEYECTVWNIAGQSQATVQLLYTGKLIA